MTRNLLAEPDVEPAPETNTPAGDDPPRDREGRDRPVCRVNTGQWCDFFIDVDTLINADKPILVGHFLTSAGAGVMETIRRELRGVDVMAGDRTFATLRVASLIHWQALKLWRKRAPVYDRPENRKAA